MPDLVAFLTIALPMLGGLFAVGAVLAIKIARRRQAPAPHPIDEMVPARPMSADHAARLVRRYSIAAAVAVVGLLVYGIFLALR